MDIRIQCLCIDSAWPSKTVRHRPHLDPRPKNQAAEVASIEALGARRAGTGRGDRGWVVPAGPDGNEFCVLKAPAAG